MGSIDGHGHAHSHMILPNNAINTNGRNSRAFVAFVSRSGFAPFAWYRIVAGLAAIAWLALR